ncbi:MAG: helix-turn-helix domain-containing protein [Steroidobacteraceae bacterium]
MRHLRAHRHRRLIEEIVRAREAAGLSQREFAAKIKRSPSYVSKVDAAERRLEMCEFAELCEALGVDAPDLPRRVIERCRETRMYPVYHPPSAND